MTLPVDDDPKLAAYAHPERLVTTAWLAEHLGDEGLVVVESDEDVLLYDTGHIPGAVKVDWHTDLNDPQTRDYVDGERFAAGAWARAASAATRRSWSTATRTTGGRPTRLWVFSLFGHEDVRLLDGGRTLWEAEGRELTRERADPDAGRLPGGASATTRRSARSRTDVLEPHRPAAGRRALPR